MSESPKFHQITKNTNLVSKKEKKKDRIATRSTASDFFRATEKRYPYVTTAAAQQQQQQHSRSSSGGGGGGGGEGGVGGGSTANIFCTAVAAAPWSTRRGETI